MTPVDSNKTQRTSKRSNIVSFAELLLYLTRHLNLIVFLITHLAFRYSYMSFPFAVY